MCNYVYCIIYGKNVKQPKYLAIEKWLNKWCGTCVKSNTEKPSQCSCGICNDDKIFVL